MNSTPILITRLCARGLCVLASRLQLGPALGCLAFVLGLAGCTAPIGADRVSTREAYAQVTANALRTGKPSADTVSILHRYDLDRLAASHPDDAVRQLHKKAVATGERDLLFALSELSFVAAERIRLSVKPWDPRDARDFYLGSAVYAWLFLFADQQTAWPNAFDHRLRDACDFYNHSLGLALLERRSTNGLVVLQNEPRRLPVGQIEVRLKDSQLASRTNDLEQIVLADDYRVRGLSVRNRQPGVGAPLILVGAPNKEAGFRRATAATALLRGPTSLAALGTNAEVCALEVYRGIDATTTTIGGASVPLELDLTTYRAYTLNQSSIWKLGPLQFLAPAERMRSQLVLHQPYEPDRIPVVFVHGTFSSPVTWAEMANTLTGDPVLRGRYQIWSFVYGSGNPLVKSIAELRSALIDEVKRLDPDGTNAALRQMVVVGHSQGGLLTKGTAIDAGDKLWRVLSTNRLDDLKIPEDQRAELRRLLYLEPLPFVSRVVFIATPHRGSYLAGGFVRSMAQRLVSLPGAIIDQTQNLLHLSEGSDVGKFLGGRMPTSLDGMAPKNPAVVVMAEIPVRPPIHSHSIVAVKGHGDFKKGKDGLVTYSSAHVGYVDSEFIVRSFHTCLNQPSVIEEVRRILHEHLASLK